VISTFLKHSSPHIHQFLATASALDFLKGKSFSDVIALASSFDAIANPFLRAEAGPSFKAVGVLQNSVNDASASIPVPALDRDLHVASLAATVSMLQERVAELQRQCGFCKSNAHGLDQCQKLRNSFTAKKRGGRQHGLSKSNPNQTPAQTSPLSTPVEYPQGMFPQPPQPFLLPAQQYPQPQYLSNPNPYLPPNCNLQNNFQAHPR
jgi:hypothetical protein